MARMRQAKGSGVGAVPLDGRGLDDRSDVGQAHASAWAAGAAGRGVLGSGTGDTRMDRRSDPDQGGAPDGAPRRGSCAAVRRLLRCPSLVHQVGLHPGPGSRNRRDGHSQQVGFHPLHRHLGRRSPALGLAGLPSLVMVDSMCNSDRDSTRLRGPTPGRPGFALYMASVISRRAGREIIKKLPAEACGPLWPVE